MLLVVLAATHLEDLHHRTTTMGKNRAGDRRSGHEGSTELEGVAIRDHQDLIEDNLSANVCRYLFYFDFFAGGNAILLAAGFYDRVHCGLRMDVELSYPVAAKPQGELAI